MNTELLLRFAAVAHLGSCAAGIVMPTVTGLWREVATLSPFARGLVRTYYCFIGLCLVGFGAGTWCFAPELAAGTPLARGVCGFLAAFWLLRFIAGQWLIDVKPFLTSWARRAGFFALETIFVALPLIYGTVALVRP